MIEKLEPQQIFVYGSNLAGNNAGGAAKYAEDNFGAQAGVGEGMNGESCYAFPTLDAFLNKRSYTGLRWSVRELYRVAKQNPHKEFLLSAVGTGIANFSPDYMKKIFTEDVEIPNNVIFPEEFK